MPPNDESTPAIPDQEEAVRRLLVDARCEDSIPADVALRLDRVLAELATSSPADSEAPTDEDASDTEADVTPLRPRRRVLGPVLMAAAVVAVAGIGLGTLTQQPSGDSARSADRPPDDEKADAPMAEMTGGMTGVVPDSLQLPRVRPGHFDDDVDRILLRNQAGVVTARNPCGAKVPRDHAILPVDYRDHRGVLAYRLPLRDGRKVALYLCGSQVVERWTNLRLP